MQSQLDPSPTDSSGSTNELWNQIAPLLDCGLEKLGPKDHDALVLRFFEGKNFAQVGMALGTSEDAAKVRVSRALEKLRKFFLRRGVNSTAAAIAGTISTYSVQAAPVALAQSVNTLAMGKSMILSKSTLTLTKGALNIMAWTKFKTAVAAGAVVIAAAGITIGVIHVTKISYQHSPLAFVGYATPEASVESTTWAAGTGDLEKVSAGITPEMMGDFRRRMSGKSEDEIKHGLIAWSNAMNGYKITQKDVIADDEVHLHIHATPSVDALHSGKSVIIMKKIGTDWKQAGQVN